MRSTNEIELQQRGKLRSRDRTVARLLTWLPWVSLLMVTLPFPTVFLSLFLTASSPDSAAVYLIFSFVSLGLGLVVGLLLFLFLVFYRRRWQTGLRDRLAADGVTAAEVPWFQIELSSEEKKTWRELKQNNALLADAYCETLAARLTATRIISRARHEIFHLNRQINRTNHLHGTDTTVLLRDLTADRARLDYLSSQASLRLSDAKARLEAIEAAAHRSLTRAETQAMLERLNASQAQPPLALELANLEEQALADVDPLPPHK